MTKKMLLLLLILLVGLVGCRRGEVQSIERSEDGGFDVTVRYSEDDFAEMIGAALTDSGNPLLRNPQVELQNGQVLVTGEHDRRDGSGERVAGSMVVDVTAQNGALLVQVISAEWNGSPVDAGEIATFNTNARNRMNARAAREGRVTEMLDVAITVDYVDLTFNIERRNND